MAERTEGLMQRIEDMHGKFVAAMTSVNNLDFHVKRLEETVDQIKCSYAVVHRFMLSHVGQRRSSSPCSGSGTPRSDGGGTSRSVSQTSLHQLLEETEQRMRRRHAHEADASDREMSDTTDAEHEVGRKSSHNVISFEEHMKSSSPTGTMEGFKLDCMNTVNARKPKTHNRHSKPRVDSESGSSLGRASRERKLSGGRKSSIRKSKKSDVTKALSPSKVCFRDINIGDDSDSGDGDTGVRKLSAEEEMHIRYVRSMSAPNEAAALHSPPKYERSLSTSSSRPRIQVIPPSSPPPIFTFTSEYTSLADELETVCMSRLSPPSSPHLHYPSGIVPKLQRHHCSESAGISITISSNPLRDAEEADYQLMEGLIQRRMHRDSENLAVSLEDLCSVKTDLSDTEDGTTPLSARRDSVSTRRDSKVAALRKRHSTTSIDNNPSELLSVPGSIQLPSSQTTSPTLHQSSPLCGKGTRLTSSQPGSPNTRRSSLRGDVHIHWASSGALPPFGGWPTPRSSPRPQSPLFVQSQTSAAHETPDEFASHSRDPQPSMASLQVPIVSETEARPKDSITETEC